MRQVTMTPEIFNKIQELQKKGFSLPEIAQYLDKMYKFHLETEE